MANPIRAIGRTISRPVGRAGMAAVVAVGRKILATWPELEAGRFHRRLRNWYPSRSHVNTLIAQSGRTVVARARYLVRNNSYATGATEAFSSNLIGTGITPGWKLKSETQRDAIQDLWNQWTDQCDIEGTADFYGLQHRVARELFIAGECFVRLRPRPISDDLCVPLQLELMPSEQLPIERNLWLPNGNRVREGIEFENKGMGKRVAYHFWKVHPGDITQSENFGEIVVIPADEILHIHDPLESGQIRGLPKLTPCMVALWMLDAYDDAELERKKTAALFSVFIKRQDPQPTFLDNLVEANAEISGSGQATIDLQPGVAHQLLPGEDVTVATPAEVGTTYDVFQYRTLTKFCAGIGLPYSTVTGDTVKANYSSQRAAMLDMRRTMESLQHSVVVFQMCRPIARKFLDMACIADAISLPGYARDPMKYLKIEWVPPPWDWIDPLKDIMAEVIGVNAGFKPRSRVVQEQGFDPVTNDNTIAEDAKRAKELDIVFTGSPGQKAMLAAPPNADPNANPDGNDPDADGKDDDDSKVMKAALQYVLALQAPPAAAAVPKKKIEVTRVTKHDDSGRIAEFQRYEIDPDEVRSNGHLQ